ncbi:MAG: DUF1553 domain-containing protein, partial [Planctomycetota bacterium]
VDLASVLDTPSNERTADQSSTIRKYYREVHCNHPDWLTLEQQERGFVKSKKKLVDGFPTTLVWKEKKEPVQAYVLTRGQYDAPGKAVQRRTPSWLSAWPEDAPLDRRGLAQWLVAPEHPLTARVAVNRFWQQLFGTGLVKTSEDFGSQGEPPSHPELLDWLAHDFQHSGWDVKRLMKMMVLTDAYRRRAFTEDEHLAVDPENRLLARGPRFRLDAETLRDQALFVSGLLNDFDGGPSVKPPQPKGLWYAVGYTRSNTANFSADEGADVFRRSLYTFWKRTSPPPQMSTFDAPSRESCTVRRERTNTPLQALLLMNETQDLESAKTLARQLVADSEQKTNESKIRWLFRRTATRPATDEEVAELQTLLIDLTAYYESQPTLAAELTGESSPDAAAWSVLVSTVMNLDEVVNK